MIISEMIFNLTTMNMENYPIKDLDNIKIYLMTQNAQKLGNTGLLIFQKMFNKL